MFVVSPSVVVVLSGWEVMGKEPYPASDSENPPLCHSPQSPTVSVGGFSVATAKATTATSVTMAVRVSGVGAL